MKDVPAISVVIVTLNNERSLIRCLDAIRRQDYPKKKIELLNVDGGSTDTTKKILKKYGFRTIVSSIPKNAEAQRGIGVREARHNLIVSLDADNYLPHKKWMRRMVQPFMDDPKVVHSGTLHFHYRKDDALFNRYNALFGAIDPIVFYIGRPDRVPQYVRTWSAGTVIKKTPLYTTVEFTGDSLPTVGCNGVVYRKDLLVKHAQSDPARFLHIDVFADLVEKGYNRFAVVDADIHHDTAVSLPFLMKKRIAFLSSYYLKTGVKRRYLIYDPSQAGDRRKLFLYIFYTVTLVKPLLDGLRGYLYLPDPAWLLHPVVCWVYLYAYGAATMQKMFVLRKT